MWTTDIQESDEMLIFNRVKDFIIAKINIKTWRRVIHSWERLQNAKQYQFEHTQFKKKKKREKTKVHKFTFIKKKKLFGSSLDN